MKQKKTTPVRLCLKCQTKKKCKSTERRSPNSSRSSVVMSELAN